MLLGLVGKAGYFTCRCFPQGMTKSALKSIALYVQESL